MGSSIIPQKPTYAMIVHRVECHAWVIIRLGHHGLNIPRDIPAEKTKESMEMLGISDELR